MKAVIVGKDHSLELSCIISESWSSGQARLERQQKKYYRDRLLEIAREHNVQFIGEEMDSASLIPQVEAEIQAWAELGKQYGCKSLNSSDPIQVIGKQVADEAGVTYGYGELDMPIAVRNERDIPWNYSDDPEKREQGDHQREQYMFEQTSIQAGSAQRVLIICGYDHIAGMRKLFEGQGWEVICHDLTKEPWFNGGRK